MNGTVSQFPGSATQAFEAAFAAARALRSERIADLREQRKRKKARKRRPMPQGLDEAAQRTWRLKEQDRIDSAKYFSENARFESGLVRERLEEGFRMFSGRTVYGRWREGVREKGLRSESFGLPGKMFVAACRKGGDLRMSWDKANLGVESRSKLLSLDLPYFEANKTFLSFFRIDVDGTWSDRYAFMDDVRQLVECRIPFAPHLVAGDELPDGRFRNPHLLFFLPYGEAVWNDPDDSRCNQRTVKFFEAVYYGIVDALRSLGADPGAPATTQRGKNPLSPLACGFTMNDREFMSLSDWAGWVDTNLNRETLVRQRAADKAGVTVEVSNGIFTAVQKEAYRILREWYFHSDLRLRAPEGTIADNLHQALEPVAQEIVSGMPGRRRMSERQVALLVSRVATYAAGSFDPARLEKGIVRKALLHVVDGLKTVRERQQVAAEYASREKAEKTLAKLVDAWDSLAVETTEVTKSGLAREAKVSRTTVQARWSDLQAVLEARKGRPVRCIDKKPPVFSAGPNNKGTVSQDMAPVESDTTVRETSEAVAVRDPEAEAPEHLMLQATAQPVEPSHRDAQRPIALPSTALSEPIRNAAPWHDGEDSGDDWDEIAQQEAFLSADDDLPGWDEPDDPWHGESVTTIH